MDGPDPVATAREQKTPKLAAFRRLHVVLVAIHLREIRYYQQENPGQCDRMVRLFFNIWSFATRKFSPILSQNCQSMLRILPNKICQRLVNFCQSGEISPNFGHTNPHTNLGQQNCRRRWTHQAMFLY